MRHGTGKAAAAPERTSGKSSKDRSIQSLRGLAAILIVVGHVIGSDPARGLRLPEGSLWYLGVSALSDFRVPLFTIISGYVYAMRPVSGPGTLGRFAQGKARRLLVPLVVVGTILFASQLVVPGTNFTPEGGEIWRVYFYGYEHLWFLQAIFAIFLLVGWLDARGHLANVRTWAAVLSLAMVAFVGVEFRSGDDFWIDGVLRLLPFFLLGYGLRRHHPVVDPRRVPTVLGAAFVVVYGLRLAVIVADLDLWPPLDRLLSLVVGVLGLLCLFAVRERITSNKLAWIGLFSYGIYLLHPMAGAFTRIALERAGVESLFTLVLLVVAAGVSLPIAFELTAGRVPIVRRLVLGVRQPPARRPAEAGRQAELSPRLRSHPAAGHDDGRRDVAAEHGGRE